MIPKVIHYCWFGGNPLPKDAKKCIESWKKHLPDYQIKEWNEENFDVSTLKYTQQAYDSKKFAFVTDYVRLYALYTEGGIYMDTDVEVLRSFDRFLNHNAFSGFESDGNVPTGMMAAEKDSIWAKELLDDYNYREFIAKDGTMDMTTNTTVITNYMVGKGLVLNNTYQDFPNLVTMYPSEYFCPKDHGTGQIHLTQNSHCIHHFAGSWLQHKSLSYRLHKVKVLLISIFGENLIKKVIQIFRLKEFKNKCIK
jgi:mannosyltransferase OCH1-like enzyme